MMSQPPWVDSPTATRTVPPRAIADRIAAFVCLVGFLLVLQAAGGADGLPLHLLTDAAFVAGLLALGELFGPSGLRGGRAWSTAGLIGATVLAGLYATGRTTFSAWVLITLAYGALAWLDRTVGTPLFHSTVGRWIARSVLAISGGVVPALISQIESRFADEEFFVAVQGVELAGVCLLFLITQAYLHRGRNAHRSTNGPGQPNRPALVGGFTGAMLGLGLWGVTVYQSSFYTADAPGYPGVTDTTPFLCGTATTDPGRPTGEEVYRRLLARIEANPHKGAPELGMLALGIGDPRWAGAFRRAIMAEAQAGRFTEPANSIKSTQHQAAQRAYYAPRVRAAFPGLFSSEDWKTVQTWFAAINRRALTVEWVDWLYALAFAEQPEGPYANQENGAGLLAILEAGGLSSPDLATINQAYLDRNRDGWARRFHNTDDAFFYQPEWITNAYFQSLYWHTEANLKSNSINRRLSLEWMLLQALPDGAPLHYNHPQRLLPAGTAYLAAILEQDPQFIWWSARMLDWATAHDTALFAQPGVENAVNLRGLSPTVGSCILYSNSGLPNQEGPLAPDKIVFRDGWTADATYMLLNLRFSGWHRYRATNSVVLMYSGGPVVVEKGHGDPFGWLPTGRSLFRDKRVPRENLSGLLVSRTGWSQVIHRLTGSGSEWAQDPPAYARVETVNWLGPVDVSRTVVDDWRGWKHTRTVYFVHRGPTIVVDSARGAGQAGVVWHLVGDGRRHGSSLWLRDSPSSARIALPATAWKRTHVRRTETALGDGDIGSPNWEVLYVSPASGQLSLATTFMLGSWSSAQYETQELSGGQFVKLRTPDKSLMLLQNDSGQLLKTNDLATDGLWALVLQEDHSIATCLAGGTLTQLRLPHKPLEIRDTDGQKWLDWEWSEGTLSLRNVHRTTACLDIRGQRNTTGASGEADGRL